MSSRKKVIELWKAGMSPRAICIQEKMTVGQVNGIIYRHRHGSNAPRQTTRNYAPRMVTVDKEYAEPKRAPTRREKLEAALR